MSYVLYFRILVNTPTTVQYCTHVPSTYSNSFSISLSQKMNFCNPLYTPLEEEKDAIVDNIATDVEAAAKNLKADTNGQADLRQTTLAHTAELGSKLKYGVLRCDYEYIPTRGDPGESSSFSSETEILKVEGWTFEAVQKGMEDGKYPASEFMIRDKNERVSDYWTKLWNAFPDKDGSSANRSGYRRVTTKPPDGDFDEEDYTKGEVYRYDPEVIEQKMKEAVIALEDKKVCGITADVGYSQAFQENVIELASVPVVMSSLQQLSFVAPSFNLFPKTKNKIMVLTANSRTFDSNQMIPPGVDKNAIEIIGAEGSLFGDWVADGNSFSRFKKDVFDKASVEEALESMTDLCKKAIEGVEEKGFKVVCIVCECAEMPAYSNGLRRRFDLPVYDTMTAIQFVQMGRGFGQYSAYMM
jgi:hypothetical protein